jgi:hypothetical protein
VGGRIPSFTGSVVGPADFLVAAESRPVLDLETAAGGLPQPFTPAAARSVGLSRDVLARGVRRGLLVRLAHGSYVLARVWADAGRRGQHLLLVAAASSQRPGACVTHHSAALLHGLPMPIACPPFVSLTTDRTHRPAGRAPPTAYATPRGCPSTSWSGTTWW